MNRFLATILGVLVLGAFPQRSRARDVVADLPQLEPWAMENPDHASPERVVGIHAVLVKEVEKRSGVKIAARLMPIARITQEIEDGTCDFSFLVWSDDRTVPGAEVTKMDVGVRAVAGVRLHSYEDLKAITVSVTRTLKLDPRFDADTSIKKELDPDFTTGVRKAEAGRVQAVAGTLSALNRIIRHTGLSAKFQDTLVLRTLTLSIQYSKKAAVDPAVRSRIDAAMASMVADGTVKRIIDEWMSK